MPITNFCSGFGLYSIRFQLDDDKTVEASQASSGDHSFSHVVDYWQKLGIRPPTVV